MDLDVNKGGNNTREQSDPGTLELGSMNSEQSTLLTCVHDSVREYRSITRSVTSELFLVKLINFLFRQHGILVRDINGIVVVRNIH